MDLDNVDEVAIYLGENAGVIVDPENPNRGTPILFRVGVSATGDHWAVCADGALVAITDGAESPGCEPQGILFLFADWEIISDPSPEFVRTAALILEESLMLPGGAISAENLSTMVLMFARGFSFGSVEGARRACGMTTDEVFESIKELNEESEREAGSVRRQAKS